MSTKVSILLFAVAALLGLFAAVGTKMYIARETGGFQVLIARQDIPAGTLVDGKNFNGLFRGVEVPNKFSEMAAWAMTPRRRDLMLGRAPSVDIPKDHLITFSQFDPLGAKREIFSQLGEGDRAMSLPVGMDTSVANVLRPGDYVDILGIFEEFAPEPAVASPATETGAAPPPASTGTNLDSFSLGATTTERPQTAPTGSIPMGGTTVRTVLQRVLVLGVGERFSDVRYATTAAREINYNVITVKVSTEQAQKLLLAQEIGGRLTLTLRRPDDTSDAEVAPTGRNALF